LPMPSFLLLHQAFHKAESAKQARSRLWVQGLSGSLDMMW
jgi:hypothetical protein